MGAFTVKAGKGGGGTEKAPVGNHVAVCVAVIDMGKQEHTFQGKTNIRRDVYLLWELPGEQIAGTGKNHVIGTALTFSFNEKATLRKWVEARTGKMIADGAEYDVSQELGAACLLNVVEKNGYPRIEGVAALPKGLPVPKPTYPLTLLTLDDIREGKDVPDHVPYHYGSPLIEHIKASQELGGPKPHRQQQQASSTVGLNPDGTPIAGGPIPW